MAGKGGKRPGAGRPTGTKSISTRRRKAQAVVEAVAEGITPLEVMLKAMHSALQRENLKEAHNYAKDAAPYIHPKLAAMTHSGPNGGPVEYRNLDKLTDDELRVLQAIQTKLG
jgi:uncharacterized protein (DUF433 family)